MFVSVCSLYKGDLKRLGKFLMWRRAYLREATSINRKRLFVVNPILNRSLFKRSLSVRRLSNLNQHGLSIREFISQMWNVDVLFKQEDYLRTVKKRAK